MTTAYNDWDEPVVAEGVYAPQEDSQLLIDVMDKTGLARGRRVADLCTGSGVIAIAAAQQGASEVTAFDICPRAAHFARQQVSEAGVDVAVHLGSWARAAEFGPYDLVVCNPPYVPHDPSIDEPDVPSHIGPPRAWDAGHDGRLVLDPLCASVRDLLADGGTMLLVQSEFAVPRQTLAGARQHRTRCGNPCLSMDPVRSGIVGAGAVARGYRQTGVRQAGRGTGRDQS